MACKSVVQNAPRHFGLSVEFFFFFFPALYILLVLNPLPILWAQNPTVICPRIERPLPQSPTAEICLPSGLEHLDPGPPDHGSVIRAQIRRGRDDLDVSEPTDIEERPEDGHQKAVRRNPTADDQGLDPLRIHALIAERFQGDDSPRGEVLEADAHRLPRESHTLVVRHDLAGRLLLGDDPVHRARDAREAELQLARVCEGSGDGPAPGAFALDQLLAAVHGGSVICVIGRTVGEGEPFQHFSVHCILGCLEQGLWEDESSGLVKGFADGNIYAGCHDFMVRKRG